MDKGCVNQNRAHSIFDHVFWPAEYVKEKGEMTMQKTAASVLARSFNARSGGAVIGIGRLSRGGRGWPLRRRYCCDGRREGREEGKGPLCLIANKGGSRIGCIICRLSNDIMYIQGGHTIFAIFLIHILSFSHNTLNTV